MIMNKNWYDHYDYGIMILITKITPGYPAGGRPPHGECFLAPGFGHFTLPHNVRMLQRLCCAHHTPVVPNQPVLVPAVTILVI